MSCALGKETNKYAPKQLLYVLYADIHSRLFYGDYTLLHSCRTS